MIDWERKARILASMVDSKRPIKEIRAMAKGIMDLMELEQQERDGFFAWWGCQGSREDKAEAECQYILAIRRANYLSEQLDKMEQS
jgi:hypothetical protein